jgi:hypothetical protein
VANREFAKSGTQASPACHSIKDLKKKIILALPPSADSMPLIRQKAGDGRDT